jgi:hypothetical protein
VGFPVPQLLVVGSDGGGVALETGDQDGTDDRTNAGTVANSFRLRSSRWSIKQRAN